MNSIMERWIGSCRRELLDRTLIWNQRHLMIVLPEYEDFCNTHRPRPCSRCPTASRTWIATRSSGTTAPFAEPYRGAGRSGSDAVRITHPCVILTAIRHNVARLITKRGAGAKPAARVIS